MYISNLFSQSKAKVMLLRNGDIGPEVVQLQRLLIDDWNFNIEADGEFGFRTLQAVRQFQAMHHDERGAPLVVDGRVGLLTWWALSHRQEGSPSSELDPLLPLEQIGVRFEALHQARHLLGQGEQGGNNRGPFVAGCLEPTGLIPPNPWCAAFVSFCFLQACDELDRMPFEYSASAQAIFRIGKDQGWKVRDPLPGDLIVWKRGPINSGLGRIGFVEEVKNGRLYTIEGNNNPRVSRFEYVLGRIEKLIGFVRVPGNTSQTGDDRGCSRP